MREWASGTRRTLDARRREMREARKHRQFALLDLPTGAALLRAHFDTWSEPDHVNRPGFESAIALMNDRSQVIVETGTSAWGTDSTRLWDAYVTRFGGEFWSVDLSPAPSERLRSQVGDRTHLIVDDSVHFLSSFRDQHPGVGVDVCYLDSWDLDWDDPDKAAAHGLAEWHAVAPLMRRGGVLVVDDSPGDISWVPEPYRPAAQRHLDDRGYLPGKGPLIHHELMSDPGVSVIWHGYNAVYRLPR